MMNMNLGQYPKRARIFDSSAGDTIELIEISRSEAGLPQTTFHGRISKELIDSYISQDFGSVSGRRRSATLQCFFSVRKGEYNGDVIPLPISLNFYERIAPYARISACYPDVLYRKTAMAVYATPQLPPESSFGSWESVQNQYLSFVLQSVPGALPGICSSISFTYHFPTNNAYVFMHTHPASTLNSFRTAILDSSIAKSTPFLIPSLLVQFNLEFWLERLSINHEEIYNCEKVMGIRYDQPEAVNVGTLEFGHISKVLNAVTADLAFMAWVGKNAERQLEFLDDVAERYAALAVIHGVQKEEAERVKMLLLESHAHLRSWKRGLEEWAEYLSKRTQASVQTVYSGIAQRDAALSHSAAIASAQDSAVMRVIAAITIIFLPATTTATFFSTSFFDFKVGPYERVYSWWLWLYWVVTIALTALVLVGAVIWWRRKEVEIAKRVGKISESSNAKEERFKGLKIGGFVGVKAS